MENLELRPLNVLIGANGAGKSNFLSVFELIRALGEDRLAEYVIRAGGANRLVHFGVKRTSRIELAVELADHPGTTTFELMVTPTDGLLASRTYQGERRGLIWSVLVVCFKPSACYSMRSVPA